MFSNLPLLILLSVVGIALLLLAFISFKALFAKGCLKQWLKGSLALFALSSSFMCISFIVGFFSYTQYKEGIHLVGVEISQIEPQHFQLTLALPGSATASYEVYGEMWQLDARIIAWSDFFSTLGLDTVYRLDRLSGRYHLMEDEVSKRRSVFSLQDKSHFIDVWRIVSENLWIPGVKARYGSGTFVPMADGAMYSVLMGRDGLQVQAKNSIADQLVKNWDIEQL